MSEEEFYLALPSSSNRKEFPDNKANHFRIRLPHHVRVEGSGWKVGMSSISLPDSRVTVPRVGNDEEFSILFRYKWTRKNHIGGTNLFSNTYGEATYDTKDLKETYSDVDGVGFMKSMVNFFEQRRIENYGGPRQGSKYEVGGKRTYIKFKFEGEDLVTDNKDTHFDFNHPPAFSVNRHFAEKMGWIYRGDKLGPNIRQEFFDETIPIFIDSRGVRRYDVTSPDGNPRFWVLKEGFLHLSMLCNWRFVNMNTAFQTLVGKSSRSLFVYSDVSESSIVGNQVTDLLREVNYVRRGEGNVYFEPLHIQYIPLRKDVLDIIETQVSETTGDLVDFAEGDTILTLHFKRT